MLYTTLTVKDREYKLKLNSRSVCELEKKIGTNPLNVIMHVANDGDIPELTTIIQLLHASLLAYEHGISLEDTYDIYDAYVEEGHNLMDIIPVILDIFKVSGFMPEEEKASKGKKTKNA